MILFYGQIEQIFYLWVEYSIWVEVGLRAPVFGRVSVGRIDAEIVRTNKVPNVRAFEPKEITLEMAIPHAANQIGSTIHVQITKLVIVEHSVSHVVHPRQSVLKFELVGFTGSFAMQIQTIKIFFLTIYPQPI
jgi:hypothetical protein